MSKPKLTVAIIIVSTTVFAGTSEDKTTQILKDVFAEQEAQCDWAVRSEDVIGDDFDAIRNVVTTITELDSPNLIVLSGGTGFAVTDVTPEVWL